MALPSDTGHLQMLRLLRATIVFVGISSVVYSSAILQVAKVRCIAVKTV